MAGVDHKARRSLQIHSRVYAAVTALFVIGNLVLANGAWFLWPVLAWGFFVFIHYLYVKSLTIDNRWVQRRARDVTETAYDAGHIEDIRKRYRDGNST